MTNLVCNHPFSSLPCKDKVLEFLFETRKYIFPGYFEPMLPNKEEYLSYQEKKIRNLFLTYISPDISICSAFFSRLGFVEERLKTDIDMFMASDPAAESMDEVIIAYPGLLAISVYRIAHILYDLKLPIIPRIMTEYAHSRTGIDIHPGATIGPYFFIDHGTGIVIGETAVIQDHVKIYHGVTLGALSLKEGNKLRGTKRHPSIGSYVTIYSGASILGGNTIVGDYSTLGCNVYLVKSVPAHSKVTLSVSIEENIKQE